MNIVFSFVGKLPEYIIDVVFQTQLFFAGDIYFIASDINSPYLSNPLLKNVKIIKYEDVNPAEFDNFFNKHRNSFEYFDKLGYRRELFVRSFERFYLLQNAMQKFDLSDVFFMEIDNMIYDNPENWLPHFSKYEICYMVDNVDRCSSGIMYVKKHDSLFPLLAFGIDYLNRGRGKEFLNEMTMLYRFYIKARRQSPNMVQILPTFWKTVDRTNDAEFLAAEHFAEYNSIFDSLPIGVSLCGIDKFHSAGKLELGRVSEWSRINYSKFQFIWKEDEMGRKIPYAVDGEREIRINNLHVHSKELHLGASKPLYGPL